MADSGVQVSVIEPGSYKSHIRRNAIQTMQKQIEASGREPSEEEQQAFKGIADRELTLPEPDAVSDAFMHALFSDEPKRRYVVVPSEDEARATIGRQITELVELNEWHAYSFSRDDLVQMLDEALAAE